MHEVLVQRLGGLSLPRKKRCKLTDRPDMTISVYRGRKTITQQHNRVLEYMRPSGIVRKIIMSNYSKICNSYGKDIVKTKSFFF